MSAGRELFARDGPDAQMDEIAARAGVGIGTVYRHFPTKEALLTAMVRDRFQQFAEIAKVAEDTVDPAGRARHSSCAARPKPLRATRAFSWR